jgi:hypothetical protein
MASLLETQAINFLRPIDGLWLPRSGRQPLKNKPNYFEIRKCGGIICPSVFQQASGF